MRYFPGEDEAWAQKWTQKLLEHLNRNNLLRRDTHQAARESAIPSPEDWNDVPTLE